MLLFKQVAVKTILEEVSGKGEGRARGTPGAALSV
jgi:hypothetical protein